MNIQSLTLALAAVAIASTTAANAAQYGYTVNDGMTGSVLTYPAVIEGSSIASPLSCAPLFGKHTWRDDETRIRTGGLLGFGSRMTVNEFAAVVPNATGGITTTKICGQKLSNSVFDIRLFGFGVGLGRVAPRMDMRNAGLAL
jgi:hypothetical protein